eukprot:1157722-Pelagomonas_calceolata.AAC.3
MQVHMVLSAIPDEHFSCIVQQKGLPSMLWARIWQERHAACWNTAPLWHNQSDAASTPAELARHPCQRWAPGTPTCAGSG